MDNKQAFNIWAPDSSVWAAWAKPVLFTSMSEHDLSGLDQPPTDFGSTEWAPAAGDAALILDLPGVESVHTGLALARRDRYRPVPLFNGCIAPAFVARALVDTRPIERELAAGTHMIPSLMIPDDAPPVFLLDSDRSAGGRSAGIGVFDNRWVVVPQDLPSSERLLAAGIRRIVLCSDELRDDLAHILRRYQEQGLEILKASPGAAERTGLDVPTPSRFRSLFYRAMVFAGLRRNSTGGFGSIVPEPASSGGG